MFNITPESQISFRELCLHCCLQQHCDSTTTDCQHVQYNPKYFLKVVLIK